MKKLRVLALEQDRRSLALLKAMLQMSGLQRVQATIDVDRAFVGLLEGDYDVAVVRGDSPRFSGVEMMGMVRSIKRQAPPVLMTFSGSNTADVHELASFDRAAALIRPMSVRQVLDRIVALTRPKVSFEDYPRTEADLFIL
jgi:DNA-binding response OmpR family regulator